MFAMKYIIPAVLALVTGCTTGKHGATDLTGPAISPDRVVVYYSIPAHYRTIGEVSSKSFAGLTYNDASIYALEEIRFQAGLLGANGVFIEDRDTAPLCGAQFHGTAILVSK